MDKYLLELPTMYADHHVLEVRRILSELPGIGEIYASSSFQVVELDYDAELIMPDQILAALEQAGYGGELAIPVESEVAAYQSNGNGKAYFRHTAVLEQVRDVVSFGQVVSYSGRPLYPCPGMGPVRNPNLEEV